MAATTAVASGDRLPQTLLIAIVVHLVLFFGIHFGAPHIQLPHVMEVTLALHRSDKDNPKADYLAQANQQGSGSADEVHQLTSPYESPFKSDQINQVQPQQQTAQSEQVDQVRRQVLTTTANSRFSHDNSAILDIQQQQEQSQQAQLTTTPESAEIATLEALHASQENDYAHRPRVRAVTSVSTREDRDAAYINAFSKRVLDVGNRNYPEQARLQRLVGNVRMMVLVSADGHIKDIQVLQSSGIRLLDEAAIRSVRLAAPFQPFPVAIRKDTDVLQIVRTWKFTENFGLDDN